MLLIAFLIGFAIGSSIQGYMSDKGSRKKLLLVTILCVIISMLIVIVGLHFFSQNGFAVSLIIASVFNGVFGNVFPVAAAAYSEQTNDSQATLQMLLPSRYGALIIPFLLKLSHIYNFWLALIINVVSFIVVLFKFKDLSFGFFSLVFRNFTRISCAFRPRSHFLRPKIPRFAS